MCAIVSSINNVINAILGQKQAGVWEYELLLTYLSQFGTYWSNNGALILTYESTCQTNIKN